MSVIIIVCGLIGLFVLAAMLYVFVRFILPALVFLAVFAVVASFAICVCSMALHILH